MLRSLPSHQPLDRRAAVLLNKVLVGRLCGCCGSIWTAVRVERPVRLVEAGRIEQMRKLMYVSTESTCSARCTGGEQYPESGVACDCLNALQIHLCASGDYRVKYSNFETRDEIRQ